jgi:SagB-type dehydrogenase family enzyme
MTKEQDIRKKLSQSALGQTMIGEAQASIIIAAEYDRTTGHYGQRGLRYVHMEVGHVGQNVSLQAISLNLGSVMIGAFRDKEIQEVLGIKEEPLYIIPVGKL